MQNPLVAKLSERAIATAEAESAIVGMGGAGIESQATFFDRSAL